MKIAVFGDSYCEEDTGEFYSMQKKGYYSDKALEFYTSNPSYLEILREKYKHDVTSFGWGGTCTYYSFKKFLNNVNKFDKVIFCFAEPSRMTIESDDYDFCLAGGINNAEQIIKENQYVNLEHKNLLKSYIDYMKYLYNQDKTLIDFIAYAQTILAKQLNVLFFSAFSPLRDPKLVDDTGPISIFVSPEKFFNKIDVQFFYINYVSALEYDSFTNFYNIKKQKMFRDIRKNHLMSKNHVILAERIDNWIKNNSFDYDYLSFNYKTIDPKENIFKADYKVQGGGYNIK